MDDFEQVRNKTGVELLLFIEFWWILGAEVLPPLLVAKLMLSSFPGTCDVFVLSYGIAKVAAARGLLQPEEVER